MQKYFQNNQAVYGLLLLVAVLTLIVAAYLLTEDTDTSLQIILIGSITGIGLVMAFIFWETSQNSDSNPMPTEGPAKAVVPLEALPPYQPMRQEPTITIQIPARTVAALVIGLAVLSMIYLRVARQERDNGQ
jgi:hypothetical protein